MASVNKVILVGNIGKDPETRYMASGEAVTNISLATTETWKDKNDGLKKEATEWHRVIFYRKLAEVVAQYTKKGSSIYVEGKLQTKKWKDNAGIDRYTTEIIADSMQLLGSSKGVDDNKEQKPSTTKKAYGKKESIDFQMDDDVPF